MMTGMNVNGAPLSATGTEEMDMGHHGGAVRVSPLRGILNLRRDGELPYLVDIPDEVPQNTHGLPVLCAGLKPRTSRRRAEEQHQRQIRNMLDSLEGGGNASELEPTIEMNPTAPWPVLPLLPTSRVRTPPPPPPISSPPRLKLHMRPCPRQQTNDLAFHNGMTQPAMSLVDMMNTVSVAEARRPTATMAPPPSPMESQPTSSGYFSIPSPLYLPSQFL